MPPLSSSQADVDLALDVEALRHLVTRRRIATILWSGDSRIALENAFRDIYGQENFEEIERSVSRQVLLTHMKLLPPLLERLFESNNDRRARKVLDIVEAIIHGNRQDSETIQFREEFILFLTQAVLQASLQVLMQAAPDAIGAAYRSTVDFIREVFESFENDGAAHKLKRTGVKLVKKIVTDLTKLDRRSAVLKVKKFLRKNSNIRTARSLQDQALALEEDLKPLVIRQNYLKTSKHPRDAPDTDHRQKGRGRKRRQVSDDKPDFFSDQSDETSNVTQEDGSPRNAARDNGYEYDDQAPASESGSRSSAGTPRPPKKRSRMSREAVRERVKDSIGVENDVIPTRSETPMSKSRGRRYPHIGQELKGMDSPMFSETRPVSERVDHVVRHARSRAQNKSRRPKETTKRQVMRELSPTSVSQEGSSPAKQGTRVVESAANGDNVAGFVHRGIDEEDEDAMGRMGRAGMVLHDLHAKATKLQTTGPSDPLSEAIRDARTARRRRSDARDPQYSPGSDAREASPFPHSDDESDMSRKRITRLQLAQTPAEHRSKREGRRQTTPRPVMQMFGKTCRTGRFESHEDDQLLKGLDALGWGAWTEIAREFWDGEYTRAPLSLKDRARTLGLDPHKYPRRTELRGRPRLSDNPNNEGRLPLQGRAGTSGNPGNNDNEDRDEDEEDPIEAPDGTPGSGDEDEA